MAEIRLYPCESSITYYIIKHGRLPKPIMSTDDTIYNRLYRDRILGINKPINKPLSPQRSQSYVNYYSSSDNEESLSAHNANSYYEYEYDSGYNSVYEEETFTEIYTESDIDTVSEDKGDDENCESNSIDY